MSTPQDPLSLHRRQCEERQHYVARLKAVAERLRTDERQLRDAIKEAFADWLAPAAAEGKPVCARALIERHGKLARVLASIEGRIAAANATLAVAARELKQRELADLQRAGSAGLSGQPAICSPYAPPAAPTAGLDCGD
jgi:hypothetical protein